MNKIAESIDKPSSSWLEYKETFSKENPLYNYAREGNTSGLIQFTSIENFINKKNPKGYTLLMLSAYNGHLETSEALIKLGEDVNSTDHSGNSILMGAAFKGHKEIVELLLRYGANKNYANSKNQTALQFAEMFGRKEIISILSNSNSSRFKHFLTIFKSWIKYINQTIFKGESK